MAPIPSGASSQVWKYFAEAYWPWWHHENITKTGEEEDVWKQRVQTHDHPGTPRALRLLERNYYGLNCVPWKPCGLPTASECELTGNRVTAGILKLDLWRGYNPMRLVSCKKRNIMWRHRYARRAPRDDRTETEGMQLQTKGCQVVMLPSEATKRRGRILPYRFQREHGPAKDLDFWTSNLQNNETKKISCCFKSLRSGTVTAARGN